jgi:hypothetical protein
MKDLTLEIKKALNTPESKEIRSNLRKIEGLNSPGLYFYIFKNNSDLDIYDANGYSTSGHQKPKVIVSANSMSTKPGKTNNGVNRIMDYAKHMNMPTVNAAGANPNPTHSKETMKYEGTSWYNSGGKVLADNLEFYGWIQLETPKEAAELEKIWNNSIERILCGKFERSTFGKGKGSMSENLMNVNANVKGLKKEINSTAYPAIMEINKLIKQIQKS